MKKLNNKILEGINKGIRFALDDYEDSELSNLKTGQINDVNSKEIVNFVFLQKIVEKINTENGKYPNRFGKFYDIIWTNGYLDTNQDPNKLDKDFLKYYAKDCNLSDYEIQFLLDSIKKYNIFNREYVDLELPSGTLWCMKNLGGEDPIDLGDNFSWGKIEKLPETSQFRESEGMADEYKIPLSTTKRIDLVLNTKDDAAYAINNHYRVPSEKQFKELVTNTDIFNVINGTLVISRKNPLNFIFFNQQNDLYLISDITNYNKNDIMSEPDGYKFYVYLERLYRQGEFMCNAIPFRTTSDGRIPPVKGHIRPIYIK